MAWIALTVRRILAGLVEVSATALALGQREPLDRGSAEAIAHLPLAMMEVLAAAAAQVALAATVEQGLAVTGA